jgi:hypothetical protein
MVIGAAGGVGSFAVQIAKAFGARVTGVCSPAKASLVRSLGAFRGAGRLGYHLADLLVAVFCGLGEHLGAGGQGTADRRDLLAGDHRVLVGPAQCHGPRAAAQSGR